MAQAISSSSHGPDDSNQSPSNIPLPSSKGSSLVSSPGARLPTPPLDSITTDLPLVAINYSGTSPSTNLPPPSRLKPPPFIPPNNQFRASKAQVAVFDSNGLVGLGISGTSDLKSPPNSGHWKIKNPREQSEDGSDLGLVNVSPITYTASPLASPTEEKFAIATQHLRQHSDVVAEEQALKTAEKQRKPSLEREGSEEVIVVPDLRPREESAADQRRRRRRLERRSSAANTPFVNSEVVQRGWVKRA